MCECLFWFERKLNFGVEGAYPVTILCIIMPLLNSSFNFSGRTSKASWTVKDVDLRRVNLKACLRILARDFNVFALTESQSVEASLWLTGYVHGEEKKKEKRKRSWAWAFTKMFHFGELV